MLLEVELIKKVDMFCDESAAATVASWLNRNYEMMFLNMWGFDFDYEAAIKENHIGSNISRGFLIDAVMSNLEKYHGIKVTTEVLNVANAISVLKNELKKNIPVSLTVNHSYCDWSKDTDDTYLLLIGYTDEAFYCYDIHGNEADRKILLFDRLEEYIKRETEVNYETYGIVSDEITDISLDTFINSIRESVYPNCKEMRYKMKQLSKCFKERFNLYEEIKGHEKNYFVPVFLNITHILRARRLTSEMLEYIYKVTNDIRAKQYSYTLDEIASMWKVQWATLWRLTVYNYDVKDPRYQEFMNTISEEIDKIADKEYNFIYGVCNNTLECNQQVVACEPHDYIIAEKNVAEIDLREYYNNQAFASSINNDEKADLSGQGECFYFQEQENGISVEIGGKTMRIPIDYQSNNNICCLGQRVDFHGIRCKKLVIIICSVWKDFYERVSINLDENKEMQIVLKVPDWYNIANNPYEVWQGNVIDFKNERIRRSLYGYIYDLDDVVIKSMVLPNDSLLHC